MSAPATWVRDEPRTADECLTFVQNLNAMSRLDRGGYLLDMMLAVFLMNAKWLRTMSYVTARDDVRGERWAECGCWFLGKTVETGHCTKTLGQGDTSKTAVARAGTLFALGGLFLFALLYTLTSLGLAAIRHLF